jgi:fatty acid desaturase
VTLEARTLRTSRRELARGRATDAEFSIAAARERVEDLFTPRSAVYWMDFLVTWSVGIGTFWLVADCTAGWMPCARWAPLGVRWAVVAPLFVVSCLALYRAVLFIHELAHLPAGSLRVFRVVWNLLVGIPCCVPSFLYGMHHVHHRTTTYGSVHDGEYVPWARRPALQIVLYLAQSVVVPALGALRFLVLAPLSWVSPRIGVLVQRRASSLVVNPAFVRPAPTPEELRRWKLLEAACFAVVATAVLSCARGVLPVGWVLQAYLTAVAVVLLNAVRTLAAHRYRHGNGGLTPIEQMLDSVTHPRAPLVTELWAPLGLRFHALHHLFPTLPYHALPAAHRRLTEQWPVNSLYRQTESPGLWASLRRLARDARTREAAIAVRP